MSKRIAFSTAGLAAVLIIAGCTQTPSAPETSNTVPRETTTSQSQPATTKNQQASVTIAPTEEMMTQQSGTKIYSNEKYGFKVAYPENLTPSESFQSFHFLSGDWRVLAPDTSKGTPVVSIPVFTIENDSSYPRYFDTELRIGVSDNPDDVQNCLKPDPNFAVQTTVKTINGIDFTVIPIQDAATMQYIQANSYRTVHKGMCFAIEQVENASDYRDQPSPQDISDYVLDGYYNQVADMIQTFTFTK